MSVHEKKQNFKCEMCDKSFWYLSNFNRHNLMVHGDKLFKCETCDKEFSCKENLKRHVESVHFNTRK